MYIVSPYICAPNLHFENAPCITFFFLCFFYNCLNSTSLMYFSFTAYDEGPARDVTAVDRIDGEDNI